MRPANCSIRLICGLSKTDMYMDISIYGYAKYLNRWLKAWAKTDLTLALV